MLQTFQNALDQQVTKTSKRITSVLKSLQRLNVPQRILNKIVFLTFQTSQISNIRQLFAIQLSAQIHSLIIISFSTSASSALYQRLCNRFLVYVRTISNKICSSLLLLPSRLVIPPIIRLSSIFYCFPLATGNRTLQTVLS